MIMLFFLCTFYGKENVRNNNTSTYVSRFTFKVSFHVVKLREMNLS